MANSPVLDPVALVLNMCRRVTLMEPIVARFDALPMLDPVERVKTSARVVMEAAQTHDYLRDWAVNNNVVAALQQLATERAKGFVELPQLQMDLPASVQQAREGGH
ncbi:hypothetical protein [Ramlibacter sp. AN1133]|uniref:hypothetical protein n=1 Tax=Ramlibacter sp. AN1133 TaxID=3133429 RepID=UPI0030C59162